MKKQIKKWTSITLAVTMMVSLCSTNIVTSTTTKADSKTVFDEIAEVNISERKLDKIAEMALKDGAKAAEEVNSYGDDADYNAALNSALTSYYETENFEQLEKFEETVDSRSEELVDAYEEAAEERAKGDENGFETGKVLAVFDSEATEEEINAVCEAQNGEIESIYKDFTGDYVAEISISLGQTIDMASEAYSQYSITEAVDSNDYYDVEETALEATNDPDLKNQYYLDNIHVKEAWDYVSSHTHDKVLVGVIDTGVQIDHPDMQKMLSPYSADITGDTPVLLKDCDEPAKTDHGTGVASIIAAEANNNRQMAGVASCYDNDIVEILAVQASTYYEQYGKYRFSIEDEAKALNYCFGQGVKVVNMSLGGYSDNDFIEYTINKMTDAGIIIVCAAGNDTKPDNHYPSDYEKCISVISTDSRNHISAFSNFGPQKDICAPGSSVFMLKRNSGAWYGDGTSMATPVVSAVAAMMCSINADLNYFDVKRIMANTATDLADGSSKDKVPYGIVNAARCIEYAASYTPDMLFEFVPEVYQNVAYKKEATASSAYDEKDMPITNLVDGKTNTKFVTESSSGQFVKVDLGKVYDIDKINIYYDRFCITGYSVKVSEDNQNWTEVKSGQKEAQYNESFEIEKQKARYVKVDFIGNASYVQLTELEVYGFEPEEYQNVAYKKEVTASSSYDESSMPISNLVDGDTNSKFVTEKSSGQFVKVDLGKVYEIEKINIYYHRFSITGYSIKVSEDNQNWTEVKSGQKEAQYNESFEIKKQKARYVKVDFIDNPSYVQLTELEVYGCVEARTEYKDILNEKEKPSEVLNMTANWSYPSGAVITWKDDANRISKGYTYNIYVDGVLNKSVLSAGGYPISGLYTGTHTFKVTACLNGYESQGTEIRTYVGGTMPTTQVPTTTQAPTTTQVPTTTQAPTIVPTTTTIDEHLLEVIGMVASCPSDNTIGVVWGQDADRMASGCKYNVYINGEKKLNEVVCAYYVIENVNAGVVTVKVTSVLNGIESPGVVQNINVTGTAMR